MSVTARGQRTRQLILERTAHVIDEQGYAGATLNRLVKSTGLTRGAFYFHFESKDALAAAIAEEQADRWQRLLVAVQRREQDPLRRLVTLVNATAFAYRDDVTVRAASRLLNDRGLINRELPRTAPWWRDMITTMLRQACEAGQLEDLSFLHRAPAHDAPDGVITLAAYLFSRLVMVGQLAAASPDAQFDLLYAEWAMVLPRICANKAQEQAILELARAQLDPSSPGPL
jgi:AcrR family transcriptional regulator